MKTGCELELGLFGLKKGGLQRVPRLAIQYLKEIGEGLSQGPVVTGEGVKTSN